jgi:response regulator RpfG family c-di-GMP phosphodiesterase
MARILVVEDDEFFGQAIKRAIEANKHQVTLLEDGKQAVVALINEHFDCVVSDVQMPVMNGIELLEWSLKNKPIPFIMMTGFAENVDTQNVLKIGAVDLLLKPFSTKEVSAAVERALAKINAADGFGEKTEAQYSRIPAGAILHQGSAQTNIYKKENGHFVKVVSRGEVVDARNFSNKLGLIELYTEKNDFGKLVPINLIVTKTLLADQKISEADKLAFVQRTGEMLQEYIKFDGLNTETSRFAKEYIECVLQNIDSASVFKFLSSLEETHSHIFANALGVTCCSLMIAKTLRWPAADLAVLTISGFFHDIGKLTLPAEMTNRSRPLLNVAERQQLEEHPRLGRDLLLKSKLFSEVVSTVVFQHHETNAGTGYPQRLVRDQIHHFARLIHVADVFCKHTLRNPDGRGMTPETAIHKLEGEAGLEDEFVIALKLMLKPQVGIKHG